MHSHVAQTIFRLQQQLFMDQVCFDIVKGLLAYSLRHLCRF